MLDALLLKRPKVDRKSLIVFTIHRFDDTC